MNKIALYARVSTSNGQNPETQLLALREYAAARKLTVFREYVDTGISGSKDSRPALNQMMTDAQRRRFDAVIVARFDRFARSTRHLVTALETFQAIGVDFISLSESLDTSTPMGKMVFVVLGAVAELERSLIKERVVMGLQRAKKQGTVLGRPRLIVDADRIAALRAKGLSWSMITTELDVSKGTAQRAFYALAQKPQGI